MINLQSVEHSNPNYPVVGYSYPLTNKHKILDNTVYLLSKYKSDTRIYAEKVLGSTDPVSTIEAIASNYYNGYVRTTGDFNPSPSTLACYIESIMTRKLTVVE